MINKAKVIKGLEFHKSGLCDNKEGKTCPYWLHHKCLEELHTDILALLKEQEPREPHYTTLEYLVNGTKVIVHHPECPRCFENGLTLWDAEIGRGQAYCKRCGQAVKWE